MKPRDTRWAAALVFFLAAFALFHANARFPYYYHTDEPAKVKQVLTGERNFHHPLLLLISTEGAVRVTGAPRTEQAVVEAGRSVSALYAALSVAALSLLAWTVGGPRAGVLAGVLALTHPVLFELAHYMKEDCTLLVGLTWCFLALAFYAQSGNAVRAGLAGTAAGLAVSGKYIGAMMLGAGLLVIALRRRNEPQRAAVEVLAFVAAAALVFFLVNFESLVHPTKAARGLGSEFTVIDDRSEERGGIRVKYLSKIGTVISLPLLAGFAVWAHGRWQKRRTEPFFAWLLLLFPVAFLVGMSVTPIVKERYLLPSFMLFCVVGSLGLAELSANHPRARWLSAGLALLALGWHLPALANLYQGFAVDDRRDLIAWIREHLPPDASIVQDRRARLKLARNSGDPAYALPQTIVEEGRYAADAGSLEDLRRRGIRYVAACDPDYQRVLRLSGPKREHEAMRGRQDFYRTLFADGKRLWERPPGRLAYLHPGLGLYEIPAAAP